MIPAQRLVISEIQGGQQTYDKPFFLNNDSFPTLQNAICWRKRVLKKPGSQRLGQLSRDIGTTGASPFTATLVPIPVSSYGSSKFVIGNAVVLDVDITLGNPATLVSATAGYGGTFNRATGALSLTHPVIAPTTVTFFPGLPVMGIEEFESDKSPNTQIDFPINVFFDQTYSYQYSVTSFFDVSFYKGTNSPVFWTGANYQQFNSCNYYRALFVTNNKPGIHFKSLTNTLAGAKSILQTGATTVTVGLTSHGLTSTDYVFINEVSGTIAAGTGATENQNINGKSGQVTVIDVDSFTITVSGANFQAGAVGTGGIAQYLTRLVSGNGDGIRWYDGFSPSSLGWVNFAPPLDDLATSATTYLMGARIIIPFGNRLLAIGTFEATSGNAASPSYFGNRIRYCEVSATPFYSSPVPESNDPLNFEPLAWASNIQGFGGFIDLDTTERIISAAVTQGALILGLESEQRRMSNTGIETDPFALQLINPDFGTAGTNAVIPMDKGILSVGEYGFLVTSSYDAKRFDEKIIDQIFQVQQTNNGYERICGARDFVNEVVYFTYYSDEANSNNKFPDTTVVYNYREGSFATWYESFTTYGIYKNSSGDTWQTYFTPWENWTTNWEDLGSDRYSKPWVAGGTPQGYVMIKWSVASFNQASIQIQAIFVAAGLQSATITSPNHNLSDGMYIGFWSGPPAAGIGQQAFNGIVSSVTSINQFVVSFAPGSTPSNIVAGVWEISIVDKFDIFTKQFQFAWSDARKTRIGAQKYFLDTTSAGEFTLNIYGSQSYENLNDPNDSSVISTNIVRTRPDDSLGLNDNANQQKQIWHRLPTSAIGDTVQLEMTLSDDQFFAVNDDGTPNVDLANSPWVFYSAIIDLYPSRTLA